VRLVAEVLQATVRIESSPGWGTRVTLRMPAVSENVSFESREIPMAYLLIVDDDEDFADAVATVCRAKDTKSRWSTMRLTPKIGWPNVCRMP
jgi:hypothetical protein